jgi:hypothetical protein
MRIAQLRHDYILRIARASVIVHDFNVPCAVIGPPEANAPLVIYPDAHLAGATALKYLQPIPWRISQIVQRCCGIQLAQLAQSPIVNISRKLPAWLALPNTPRVHAPD